MKLEDDAHLKAQLQSARRKIEVADKTAIDPVLAENIIENLRFGVVPQRGTLLLSTGREQLLSDLEGELEKISKGASGLQILNGAYGMGKSFILSILREFAFRQNFAVSYVTLTRRECPLYDFASIYRYIIRGIRVAERQTTPALEVVLQKWAECVRTSVGERSRAPWSFLEISRPMKDALAVYFESYYRNRPIEYEKALAWLRGDIAQLTEARKLGIGVVIDQSNALSIMGDWSKIIREIGYKGLVILLDEAEQVPSYYQRDLQKLACDNLIDLSNCYRNAPFSFFVYATTPHFLECLVDTQSKNGFRNQKITDLHGLTRQEYVSLATVIKEIYSIAYGDAFVAEYSDRRFQKFIQFLLSRQGGTTTPRFLVRNVIAVLDHLSEAHELGIADHEAVADIT